jgi:hypothetical protein
MDDKYLNLTKEEVVALLIASEHRVDVLREQLSQMSKSSSASIASLRLKLTEAHKAFEEYKNPHGGGQGYCGKD